MPVGKFSITVQGTERIERQLMRYRGRALDPAPVFQRLSFDMRAIMGKQFDSSGAYLGKPWAALAPATVIRKKRRRKVGRGGDPRILHDYRRMRKSYTVGSERRVMITADSYEIGSKVPYVGFHMTGTKWMPQRIVFRFDRKTASRWTKAVQNYIARGVIQLPPL